MTEQAARELLGALSTLPPLRINHQFWMNPPDWRGAQRRLLCALGDDFYWWWRTAHASLPRQPGFERLLLLWAIVATAAYPVIDDHDLRTLCHPARAYLPEAGAHRGGIDGCPTIPHHLPDL